ncbi:MAG: mycothiol synthase [Actinobacteria bacterium]|nr:mycothiol synthase [Actinomycetota bacterium]
MVRLRTVNSLSGGDRQAVANLLATTRAGGCARLTEAAHSHHPVQPVTMTIAETIPDSDHSIVGYAQASEEADGYIIDSAADDSAIHAQVVRELAAKLPTDVALTWWTHECHDTASVAASLGLRPQPRRLLNMSRSLPIEAATDTVKTRPFVVGRDEAEWLRVNNAAFIWHGEQGEWEPATLSRRISEPWFDPAGFLLHERDGHLAAFCWTKVHNPPTLGEIYVIAVHPDYHGLGLGRSLTVAGLRHLGSVGSTTAMLYVESDNTAAVRLYESLGFTVTHTDLAYQNSRK